MESLQRGRYRARLAGSAKDVARAQALRHLCFHRCAGSDADAFDSACLHVLVEDRESGDLVCCYRLMVLAEGEAIGRSYSAQYYDLSQLSQFRGPIVEMGRFCVAPGQPDPDILRLAWGMMTRIVDGHGARLLFGCASFAGTDADAHAEAFSLLRQSHLAPRRWLPRVKAPRVFRFAQALAARPADARRGFLAMPPLLRTYLGMGGWVSDHAVIDEAMNTLHVFTGVEVSAIPEARARALRNVAQGA